MVNLFLADGFEEIEALTAVDVLKRAEIDIQTISIKKDDNYIIGRSGIKIKADNNLYTAEIEDGDMIILPGGMPGTTNLETNREVQRLIKYYVDNKKWIAAICAAPSILGKANYLNGINAICYPGFEKFLEGANIVDKNVVVDGIFITSKGAGTAMDFAFKIVEVFYGKEKVKELKDSMVWSY
jgi:4-methyl-5(b-hydroxyethyl)-thiazole monophosphate biosynthesis